MNNSYIIKGSFCYCLDKDTLAAAENSYLVCANGVSQGIFEHIPEKHRNLEIIDYSDKIIIPGMSDLHIHAPQYTYRGLGMDMELLDWLNTYAFPEEARYADIEYAGKAYEIFAASLRRGPTTRACIFATLHLDATVLLMDIMEKTGLKTYVGKVNMDRNSPDILRESSAESALSITEQWLQKTAESYENTKPIITPRFIPSCSDSLMTGLGMLRKKYNVPTQSHLSENFKEIELVQNLCPTSRFYGDAYNSFDLFGKDHKCIMSHCVHSSDAEINLMKENGVYIAHCPQSNTNIASGIAPVRKYLDNNLNVGLGSDVAGGSTDFMFRAVTDAIQVSKLRWRMYDQTLKPLSFTEGFYLATVGGGAFCGNVGSFSPGYEFDAVVIDDSSLPSPRPLSLRERLERAVYLADDRYIYSKFVAGKKLF